jgi:RHS repeat-associated protein
VYFPQATPWQPPYSLDAMGQRLAVTETLYLPDLIWQYLPLVLHAEPEEEESLLGGGEQEEAESLELPTEAALGEGYPGPEEEMLEAAPTETATPTAAETPTATPTPDDTPTPLPSETPTPGPAEELAETPEAFAHARLARPAFEIAAIPAQQFGPETTTVITYVYDSLYRLLEANYSTGVYFHNTYDQVGNRLTEETLNSTTSYEYDDSNRLVDVEDQAYTWDDNGNLLDDGARTYEYDAANRLVEVSDQSAVTSHQYNGFGDRLVQTINSTPITYTLDLNLGLTQVLADGENTYLYGVGRIGEQQPDDFFYHLPDGLGSVRQLADANADVQLARNYQPYGGVLRTEGVVSTAFGYTGEATDGASGLVYLRARHYAPGQGRFLTRDAWPGDVYRPHSLNAWLYAEANPINLVDPTGHAPCVGDRYDDGPHCVQHPESRWYYDNVRYQRECRAGEHGCDEIFAYAEVGAAVLFEPLDWALTVRDLAGGDCSPLVVLGLLPLIPGSLAKHADNIWDVVPKGFRSADDFEAFGDMLRRGLRDKGYDDVVVAFRGSSVTGVSYRTGEAFDAGRISDYDVALVSPRLMAKADELGIQMRSRYTRTAPLDPKRLEQLGLTQLAAQLSESAGRRVSFMIYDSLESVLKRGPGTIVP